MKETNSSPNIRFKNFTNDWEQRNLNNISEINPSSKIPSKFNYVDLESVQGTELKSFRRESIETAPSRAQRLAMKGDLFYQTVRPYQKNNYLFKRQDTDFVFSTGYAQVRPEIDGDFLLSLVQTSKFVNSVLVRCTGTSYPAINSNDLSLIPMKIPKNNDESTKIGTFFSSLDNIITLHQRKLEQLQTTKKTFLNKLFPKNKYRTPEIRFDGYRDAWEQRKLNEVAKYESSSYSSNQFKDSKILGKYPIFDANEEIFKIDKYDQLDPYISIIKDGAGVGRTRILPGKSSIIGTMGYIIPNDTDINFLINLISNINWNKYITGTTIPHIYFSQYGNETLLIPNNTEQEQIGSIFKELDNLITLHQRKVEVLEMSKKYYLKHMFV